jgi:hypothetical protein
VYLYLAFHYTYSAPQDAKENDDYNSIAEADCLLLVAGDSGSEDEPMRKGTCLQVRFHSPFNSIQSLMYLSIAMAAWLRISFYSFSF